MTILPIKKTNKEKTPPEQPSHDHNGSLNQVIFSFYTITSVTNIFLGI